MRKRKWYERMSAAALIAVLLVNHGDMGIMAKAETIPALEENLEEENKKIEAETASESNADEKPVHKVTVSTFYMSKTPVTQ